MNYHRVTSFSVTKQMNLALNNVRPPSSNPQKITRDNAFEVDYRFICNLSLLVKNDVENSWLKSSDAIAASAKIYGYTSRLNTTGCASTTSSTARTASSARSTARRRQRAAR